MLMNRSNGYRGWLRVLVIVVIAAGIAACGKGGDVSDAPGASAVAGDAEAGSAVPVQTQPPNADPCKWMTQAEVEAIVGKLERPPFRNDGAEAVEPAPDGETCAYVVAPPQPTTIPSGVYVEVATHDGTQFSAGVMVGLGAVSQWLPPGYSARDTGVAGPWDHAAGFGKRLFTARQGDAAVMLTGIGYGIPKEQLGTLAAKIIAKIPDIPTAAPPPVSDGDREEPLRDPCSLVTAEEAEQVLGKLAVAPYQSRTGTSMASANGGSCSYRTPKHRVMVLSPTWEGGQTQLKMAAVTAQQTSKVLGGTAEADTLEGPWDQVAGGASGEVYFLKGDALLSVQYNTSAAGIAGAVSLARLALGRF